MCTCTDAAFLCPTSYVSPFVFFYYLFHCWNSRDCKVLKLGQRHRDLPKTISFVDVRQKLMLFYDLVMLPESPVLFWKCCSTPRTDSRKGLLDLWSGICWLTIFWFHNYKGYACLPTLALPCLFKLFFFVFLFFFVSCIEFVMSKSFLLGWYWAQTNLLFYS